jgi:hypothetical protein
MSMVRVGAMRGRMTRLRRMLAPPAIALGLVSSLGATQCAVDQPRTATSRAPAHASAKKAKGTVVRCHGTRSCDITFRRATTERYFQRLRDKMPPAVLAKVTTETACLLVTHTIAGHIVCAAGSSLVTKQLTASLKRAAAANECLTIHIQPPDAGRTWRPISYAATGGRDCAP